ncbi:PepSY-associated TM helix domain-containing protein [Micromonospora cathayae]|uniref:PepSY-associated TM helix domain-containing protein n=1 Tax=Micromonospora cathayae TaxID=3028804 RepID=A0ABY7ZIZ4_9ACTN|nr:PepSY-associated TM helix domain-containing protein [Micromonospora sp. HUAS 3]WDZ82954.1 PepSY-associated TM helix domain-containing protein [Micromonospora sp. HUAS 3]
MSTTSTRPAGPARSAPTPAPRPPAGAPGGLGALLLRLHFYAGVLIAPFLVVAALTGLAYTVTPQLDTVVYGRELRADAAGRTERPLSEQVAAARAAHPDGTLAYVAPGGDGTTTQVVFDVPELTEDRQHSVYVDPYTAEVKGQLTTWFGYTPLRTWFDDLHRNLHLGPVGRHYSELAASWLWVVALGGLALWWRRQRGARNRARRLLLPDLTARRGVRRTRGWHASTGVWLLVGLLFLSATGLTWSRYAGGNVSAGLDALGARKPALSTALDGSDPAAGGGHHGGGAPTAAPGTDPVLFDQALQVARAAGLDGPVEVTPPADASSAWTVEQTDETWPVRQDRVTVDPAGGTVVDRSDFADWPLLAKLSDLGISAHMGLLFGPVNQIMLAALALGLLVVIFWGYRMWWQRRPTRAGRRPVVGAPPVARGAWWGLPSWLIVVGLPAVFLLCWVVPLFGVTLVGFLVVDLAVAALRRRRPTPPVPVSPAPAGERSVGG